MKTSLKRLLTLLLAGVAVPAGAQSPGHPVLMISIDGLRPGDVLEARQRDLHLPFLAKLLAEGTYARGVRGVLPSVTYPSHTTLMTGVAPAAHGIASNLRFDPMGRNLKGWYWYADLIRQPTLWGAVKAAGGHTASLGWPVTVGQPTIDANIPEYWRTRTPDDLLLLRALSTPGLVDAAERASGAHLDMGNTDPEQDVKKAKAAAWLAVSKPRFFTVHLSSLDHQEHVYGPGSPEANKALEQIDTDVATIVNAARRAQPNLVVAIVSDHGFARVTTDINLFPEFVRAGLIRLDDKGAVTGWDAMPWPAGGAAAVTIARRDDATLRDRVGRLLRRWAADPRSGIATVLDATALAKAGGAPDADYFLDAAIGHQFTDRTDGALVTPSSGKGTHGYFPSHPEMLSTFIVAGPDIARGGDLGQIDMRDIAPTIAGILNVPLPTATGRRLRVEP